MFFENDQTRRENLLGTLCMYCANMDVNTNYVSYFIIYAFIYNRSNVGPGINMNIIQIVESIFNNIIQTYLYLYYASQNNTFQVDIAQDWANNELKIEIKLFKSLIFGIYL